MAEYIDREALLEDIDAAVKNSGMGYVIGKTLKRYVKLQTAADVASVRHGRWEQCFEDWRKQIEGDKCSLCGFEHYGTSIRDYLYCPNCGAKMDEEDKNHDDAE